MNKALLPLFSSHFCNEKGLTESDEIRLKKRAAFESHNTFTVSADDMITP